jgi:tetratricopeptide (TPR) repeat protein
MDKSGKKISKKKTKLEASSVKVSIPSTDDFNLSYGFSSDLLEVPEDPQSVFDYCHEGAVWINQEMLKPESEWDIRNLVATMGKVATFLKMIRELDDALEFIETALALIEQYDLGPQQFVVQSLRWADILRYRGDFSEAEEAFEGVLEVCEKVPSVSSYKDFALQHLGKLKFDLEDYTVALEFFEKALVIRKKKKDQSLIDSYPIPKNKKGLGEILRGHHLPFQFPSKTNPKTNWSFIGWILPQHGCWWLRGESNSHVLADTGF